MLKHKLLGLLFLLLPFTAQTQEIEVITQERIQGFITFLTYSPDGTLIASGSALENSIKVWDVKSGKIIGQLEGHEGATTALAFSPDGKKLVSAAKDNYVIYWDIVNWKMIDSTKTEELTKCLVHDPNRQDIFYSASYKGHVHEWTKSDMDTPTLLFQDNDEINKMDAYGDLLAVGNDGGKVTIFNLESKEIQKSKKAHLSGCMGLRFFDKGVGLISVGKGGLVHLWNVTDFSESKHIKAASVPITAFDANIEKRLFVTATQKEDIRIWNFEGEEVKYFKGEDKENKGREPIKAIALSPDGTTVASAGFMRGRSRKKKESANVIRIWDAERGALSKVLKGTVNPIYSFDFHPSENKLVTLGENRTLTFWDFDLAEKYGELVLMEPERVVPPKRKTQAANAAIDETVSTATGGGSWKDKLNPKRIANKVGNKLKDKSANVASAVTKRMFKEREILKFSANGKYLITKMPKDDIRLYNLEGQRPEFEKVVHSYQPNINQLLSSPDGKYLAVLGSGDRAVSIIDLETGEFIGDLNTEAPKIDENSDRKMKLKFLYEANSLAFSPDGKYLAVCFNTSKTFVYSTTSWNVVFQNTLPDNLGYVKGAFVNFSQDGSKMIVNTMLGIQKFNTSDWGELGSEKLKVQGKSAPMDKPSDYAITLSEGYLWFENIFTGETKKSIRVEPKQVTHISISTDGKAGITLKSGQFLLLDPATGKEHALLVADGDNYIFKTQNNYYKVSKEGYELVTYRIGNQAFPFEQFDAVFNRPDIVLRNLGCKDEELMNLYEMAYQKRIKKLGLTPSSTVTLSDIPTTKVKNSTDIPGATADETVSISFDMKDGSNLKSYNIWVNNVPIYGKKGKSVSGTSYSGSENIGLVHGTNKIQVSCRNAVGYESLIQTFYVEKSGDTPEKNLYLVTIGTSTYKDPAYNLNYAVKDAKDMIKMFSADSAVYTNVYSESLYDQEVTAENVEKVHDFLKNSKPDDIVLVFAAGHGVLDNNFDYYFGTYDMDFGNPSAKGLPYEKLEGLLDGIKANKKILIMDTCHSGEIDKDDVFFAEVTEEEENESDDIAFRSVGAAVKEDASMATPSRLAGELFNDLRKGTGSTVISSAGGAEFAMESDEWKNGLFTYCMLDGMKSGTADIDGDGQIMLLELQEYVVDKVKALSKGRQVPNSRIQNMELDFRIW